MAEDIRWQQRFSNFKKAFSQLENAVELFNQRKLTPLEEQGLIQGFEYTFELAWNTMKDYFTFQGNPEIKGSRDAIREAFKRELIRDGDTWMKMIQSRVQTSHTYNEEVAVDIIDLIVKKYYAIFKEFEAVMSKLTNN